MQTSFDFTPGLTVQFPTLRDVLCACVYGSRSGLKGAAADLDLSPSELSRMLNRDQDDPRKLDVSDFVALIESTGDTRPVQWLIERFLHNPDQQRAMAAAQLAQLIPGLLELAKQAGVAIPKGKR
jgi:hypothetical protein